MLNTPIPIIDIFAGPGGLGEGFSSCKSRKGDVVFKVLLSIEKDVDAYNTLLLRTFFREFRKGEVPTSYYEYLRGNISRDDLFKEYPIQTSKAKKEAWRIELKKSNREKIKNRINSAINGATTWVLIGGPPCQAYSLVGRSRMRNNNKIKYSKDQRHFLYKEYLQILADNQPPVFVMENVKGLLSSQIKKKNTFSVIISDLKNPLNINRINTTDPLEYTLFSFSTHRGINEELNPEDFIVRSEEYGIPQARHRIFIFGIRSDLKLTPKGLLNKINHVSINEVISDLPKLRSGLSKTEDSIPNWYKALQLILTANWLNSVSPSIRSVIVNELSILAQNLTRGSTFIKTVSTPRKYIDWYQDDLLKGICNHETRGHIVEDLHRYFFASVFAKVKGSSPTLEDFPKELLPKHKNVQKAIDGSLFNDRFRVQVFGKPSTTVVSHISKDGHYYIHYDPGQCRSLTVREAARLQTFPDNYFFEGTRTQQYHQVGNAVPPLLAQKIALIVKDTLDLIT